MAPWRTGEVPCCDMEGEPTPTLNRGSMFGTRKLIAGLALSATAFTGLAAPAAFAESDEAPSLTQTATEVVEVETEAPEEYLAVFSADARINGERVQDEWIFAFGVDTDWPYLGGLWLLTDAETDEWIPLCVGYVFGDDEGVVFLGESIHGDEGDGCAMVGIGDEGDVYFGAIELEGDEILTAALYNMD